MIVGTGIIIRCDWLLGNCLSVCDKKPASSICYFCELHATDGFSFDC